MGFPCPPPPQKSQIVLWCDIAEICNIFISEIGAPLPPFTPTYLTPTNTTASHHQQNTSQTESHRAPCFHPHSSTFSCTTYPFPQTQTHTFAHNAQQPLLTMPSSPRDSTAAPQHPKKPMTKRAAPTPTMA